MRRIAIVLFCVLICQSVCAQTEEGHMNKYFWGDIPYDIQPSELDINGNVRQVLYEYHHLQFQYGDMSISGDRYIVEEYLPYVYKYNTDGHLIRYEHKNGNYYTWDLEYDANGNVTESGAKHIYENGKLTKCFWGGGYGARFFYTNGELSKIVQYDRDGIESSIVYFQNGDPVKITYIGSATTITYSYNNHRLIRSYNHVTGIEWKYTYEDGLVSRCVKYKNGKFSDRYDYIYKKDAKGNWIMRFEVWTEENGDLYVGIKGRCGKVTTREITYQ